MKLKITEEIISLLNFTIEATAMASKITASFSYSKTLKKESISLNS